MSRKSFRLSVEMRGRKGQEMKRKPSKPQVKHRHDVSDVSEEELYLLNALIKYSRCSWSTWFVLKIFIKLTTYSMLLARDMEEEAHKWISDWGPIVNPFIDYFFFPVSRLVIFFYHQTEPFSDDVYYVYILPLYTGYIQNLLEPSLYLLQTICSKIMIFNIFVYETLIWFDLGILIFICLFLVACGDIACFYWKMEMKKIYRKVKKDIDLEYEHEESLRYKKRRSLNSLINLISLSFLIKIILLTYNYLLTHFFPNSDSKKMLKEMPESLLELEHMCSDNEMNSSNSLRGKPLLEDLIREEILRSKEKEKKEKPNNLRKVDGRIDTENDTSKNYEIHKTDIDNPTKPSQPSLVHSCWSCDKPGRSLLKCSACRKARYCGEACQGQDWGRHRGWCRRRGQTRERRGRRTQRRSLASGGNVNFYEDEEVD